MTPPSATPNPATRPVTTPPRTPPLTSRKAMKAMPKIPGREKDADHHQLPGIVAETREKIRDFRLFAFRLMPANLHHAGAEQSAPADARNLAKERHDGNCQAE
jgi:hypothetical protein